MIQCAGEAVYTDDIPTIKDEVFASFALCTVTKGEIESVDASMAMKIDGVIAVLTSRDIPGINSFIKIGFYNMTENEELLANNQVRYYNQPVAIVVAKTQAIADRASNFVKVNYKNISKRPLVLTIEDAIKAPKDERRLVTYTGITPTERGANVRKVIKGRFVSPISYHFMTELHTTVVKPVDEGLEVHCSTQWQDHIQASIAQVLNMPESLIIVNTKRCGGAFGCKIARANLTACAAALVAKTLNKPCRMSMRLPDIMRAMGKRCNSRLDYEVGVDDEGQIQYMDAVFYVNDGFVSNENENPYATNALINCYNSNRWKVDSFGAITDMPGNCYMRAPGGYEGIAAIEHIMDHIAREIKNDPISVRKANYRADDNQLPTLVPKFIERVDYRERQKFIKKFNNDNRWKKRGISLQNMAFRTTYLGNYSALVAVYHGDGSVIVNIGGVEIGQGIFTRIAQVAARELLVPVEKVTVIPCYNFATPNNYATGSSITTECSAYAVIRCCDQINARLAPIRAEMPTATWQQIVQAADNRGINLQANYLTSPNDPRLVNYSIFGIAVTEVEVDILTGMKWIVRVDILEDAGRSINPVLDIGQVEGAFIQALSSWIMEEIKFNKQSGELYTDRSWNYKIFGAKDIPHDFRVYLQRRTSNPVGILGSKAVSEPPICLGYGVVESLRSAILDSRHESGYTNEYITLDIPVSNESVVHAAEVKIKEYVLY
ncbi:xanthine dehydrogenase-like [Ostrinia nubilalis]|uniref:xanthine dehydrogenase-like n=1 Tax=Ostrinia nubilalis TaxID=29057 RepID=UPI0030824851